MTTPRKPYAPHGKIVALLAAMQAEPTREFTSREAAAIMDTDLRTIHACTKHAVAHGLIFRRCIGRRLMLLRATPFPTAGAQLQDVWVARTPQVVPGWKPPTMRCARTA